MTVAEDLDAIFDSDDDDYVGPDLFGNMFLGESDADDPDDSEDDDGDDESTCDNDESDPEPEDPEESEIKIPLPGFDIRVEVDGERLDEFDYPYDRPFEGPELKEKDKLARKHVKYLQCEPGTHPVIVYKYNEDFEYATPKLGPTIRLEFYVDVDFVLTHCDNFKARNATKWEKCRGEFAGKTHGKKNTRKCFGRRDPVSVDKTIFRRVDLCISQVICFLLKYSTDLR